MSSENINSILSAYGLPPCMDELDDFAMNYKKIVEEWPPDMPFISPLIKDAPRMKYICTEGTDFNAAAFLHEGEYYICVNAAVYVLTWAIIYTLYSNRDFLPEVGDSHLESDRSLFPAELKNVRIPNVICPIRREIAQHAASLAVNFVLFHELAHVFRGHVALISSDLGYGGITENIVSDGGEIVDRELRIAQESDADRAAVRVLSYGVLHRPYSFFYKLQDRYDRSLTMRIVSSSIQAILVFMHPPQGVDRSFMVGYPPLFHRMASAAFDINMVFQADYYKENINMMELNWLQDLDIIEMILGRKVFSTIDKEYELHIEEAVKASSQAKKIDKNTDYLDYRSIHIYCLRMWDRYCDLHRSHAFTELYTYRWITDSNVNNYDNADPIYAMHLYEEMKRKVKKELGDQSRWDHIMVRNFQ